MICLCQYKVPTFFRWVIYFYFFQVLSLCNKNFVIFLVGFKVQFVGFVRIFLFLELTFDLVSNGLFFI